MRKYFLVGSISLLLLFSASFVFAQTDTLCDPTNPTGGQPVGGLCNPLQSPNLPDLLTSALGLFAGFFGITTIVMVVFAGLRMIISMGNPQALQVAKSALVWSLGGFVLAMFSFALVMAISDYLGAGYIDSAFYNSPSEVVHVLNSSTLLILVERILTGFLALAATLALLMIIVSGFRYGTAAGNEQQLASAKASLQWAIIGLIVIIFGYVIVQATFSFFAP